MILHIFNRETVYSHQYIKFIASHYDITKHLFVFRSKKTFKKFIYEDNVRLRITFTDNLLKYILFLFPRFLKAQNIIFHYLSTSRTLYFWYLFQFLLKKVIWIPWGYDLYFFQKKNKSKKENRYEFLRKIIINKIYAIATSIKEDYDVAKEIYKTNAIYFNAFYPNPLDYNYLEKIMNSETISQKSIQIGNSANPLNFHNEVFKILRDKGISDTNILCPLPYSGPKNYIEEVIRDGKEYFGEYFSYFTERLPPKEFGELLKSVDVAIMNHNRQQGVGNILGLLFLGKKVYMRNDITTYKFLSRNGIKIFSIEELKSQDTNSIFKFSKVDAQNNNKKIREMYSTEECIRRWDEIFKK